MPGRSDLVASQLETQIFMKSSHGDNFTQNFFRKFREIYIQT